MNFSLHESLQSKNLISLKRSMGLQWNLISSSITKVISKSYISIYMCACVCGGGGVIYKTTIMG